MRAAAGASRPAAGRSLERRSAGVPWPACARSAAVPWASAPPRTHTWATAPRTPLQQRRMVVRSGGTAEGGPAGAADEVRAAA